jgi:myosin heavy subunit
MKSQLVEQTGSLRLVESKTTKKGCLGRLEGPCADFKNKTRNGRLYGLQLWKNVFDNKFVKEALATKTLFGELDHPEDRFEVLSKYACVCMTDYEINENDGLVYGGFDILDTEAGRILKSLVDYGSQMGVSSRGEGDIIQGADGEEVDPDTFEFACFDVVSTPAVERARQTVVESVEHDYKKRRLIESIEKEIKNADTIEVLDNIDRTVTNCNAPNLSRIKRSIKNRKSQIIEGKTISSTACNSAKINNKSNRLIAAETIGENLSKIDTVNSITELNRKIRAYKLREKQLNNTINVYKTKLNEANNQIEKINQKLDSKSKALKESNNKRLNVVRTNQQLENQLDVKNNQIDLLENVKTQLDRERKNHSQINKKHLVEKQRLNAEYNDLEKTNKSLKESLKQTTDNLYNLQNQNKELRQQLKESTSIIDSYKIKQEQLKDSLVEHKETIKQQNITIENKDKHIQDLSVSKNKLTESKRDLTELEHLYSNLENSYNELENSYSKLDIECNDAVTKYNELLEQYNSLQNKVTHLTEKLKQSVKLNKQYTQSFLNECATNNGINPKSVTLNESVLVPNKIKQLVEEVKDRQDRYNKLPISYDTPTTVNILSESIKKDNVEEEDIALESFLSTVQGQF